MPAVVALAPEVISRAEAVARGLTRYFTGRPCKRGHVAARAVVNNTCVECVRAAARRTYLRNSEKAKDRSSTYYHRNKESINAAKRAESAARRATRVVDPAIAAARKEASRRRRNEQSAAYRKRHADRLRARRRAHYQRTKAACAARFRKWHQANPQSNRDRASRRRARELAATVGPKEVVRRIYSQLDSAHRMRCYWCKQPTKAGRRHVDHIIPLSKGGAHAAGNLCISCDTCNLRKSALLPEVFAGQTEMPLV